MILSLGTSALLHALFLSVPPAGLAGVDAEVAAGKARIPLSVLLPRAALHGASLEKAVMPAESVPPPPGPRQEISVAAVAEPGPTGQPGASALSPPGPPAVKRSISGPFGPWYYPARYLHRRVTPLMPIWPRYPPEAETISGRVTILLLVDEYGQVDQHRIVDSDPAGVFDAAVIEAFARQARFAPGLIAGYPVKAQLLAEVSFEPGAPPQTSYTIMDPQQTPTLGLPPASSTTHPSLSR